MTLLFAGLVTSDAVSVLGAIVSIAGAVGWFRDVLPHERHESVPAATQMPDVTTIRRGVDRLEIAHDVRRVWLPLEVHPISAGVKGGLAGSAAMAILAMLYGVLNQHSIWYPINLLAAGFFPSCDDSDDCSNRRISTLRVFLIAVPIHLITSLLVGLLYGSMLPMLPQRPVLLGGFIAPILWTGLIYSILGIVNPVLEKRIDWLWFVFSQVGFGIVAGLVVSRQQRVRTTQHVPLALRFGMEASGMRDEKPRRGRKAMTREILLAPWILVPLLAMAACGTRDGGSVRPPPDSQVIPPAKITDFNLLYTKNCAGCHGRDGKGGLAVALGGPGIPCNRRRSHDHSRNRRRSSWNRQCLRLRSTPAGVLTDSQIDAIIRGMRERWARPDALRNADPPPYAAAQSSGDPKRGSTVFGTYCSSCHGADGRGGKRASSIVDGSYLALVSDQNLRTIVIVGRPEMGAPDWREDLPGKRMSCGRRIRCCGLARRAAATVRGPYQVPCVQKEELDDSIG